MDFTKVMGYIFSIIFIIILFAIIYYALRIMSKDVQNGSKNMKSTKRQNQSQSQTSSSKRPKGTFGSLEVMATLTEGKLRVGTTIPINNLITLGRKSDNLIILNDQFVSSHHAKIFINNDECFIEDLNSTNGTFVNEERVLGTRKLMMNDSIRLGSTVFKVIG
ncbi:FHA domain-containing protein [Clostridium sp.]|uniref:FHA domain-containing protein n=1 Tax=Clostridium sp. TaxID=1506 RepID=UPI0039959A4E